MEGVRGKGSSKVQAGEVTKSKHQGKHRPRSPASEQRNPSSQRNASGAVRRETGTPDHNDTAPRPLEGLVVMSRFVVTFPQSLDATKSLPQSRKSLPQINIDSAPVAAISFGFVIVRPWTSLFYFRLTAI